MATRNILDSDVQFVKGVGPVRAKAFAALGVRTVGDLIEYFPFRHELRPKSIPIGDLELGQTATIVGSLRRVRTGGGFGRPVTSATVEDGTGRCRIRFFNSPHMSDLLHEGQVVRATGKVGVGETLAIMTNPQLTPIEHGVDPFVEDRDRFDPVYPATEAMPSRQIARVVDRVLEEAVQAVVDFLPDALRSRRKLPPRPAAILRFHKPLSPDDVPVARRRLAYDELLLCQLAVQMGRRRMALRAKGKAVKTTDEIDRRIRARFPFALTAGQDRAVAEIRGDLARKQPMNRMLQADVGAGKTAVAVYAALATIASGRQVVILAPTEVLAAQHRTKVERYLSGSRVGIGYLVGSTTKRDRKALLTGVAAGKIDLVIGTHALIEPDVRFNDLGLVIIDEQHKFGVEQRAKLRGKGRAAHTLVLTATPIPRTLAMTAFGDLDVSTIDGSPPNRQPIATRLITPELSQEAWQFVRSRLAKGEQAYVVYPLVEESESLPLKAAGAEVERLGRAELEGFRLGLLHGRMKPAEKADVMCRFREGDLDALIATTVIEVGVDVPNATVMVVQHAERYGLSQLHQLRGRIGRGSKRSYCMLFAESSGEPSQARLRILCETTDGFRIAEEDLRLRGPGELLGTRQHGLPELKVADLVADFGLLEQARDDAVAILRRDSELKQPAHAKLREVLMRQYGQRLKLMDVA